MAAGTLARIVPTPPDRPAPGRARRALERVRRAVAASRLGQLAFGTPGERRPPDPRRQRLLLVVASVMFTVAAVVAWRQLPAREQETRWVLLVAVGALGAPLTILVNALEYAVIGRMVDVRVPARDAVQVSVLASAANLLPIPGAVLVRVRALQRLGAALRPTLAATGLVGLAWVGVALAVAGALQVADAPGLAALLVAGGGSLVALFAAVAGRGRPRAERARTAVAIVGVELTAVAVGSLRLWLALLGLGFDGSPGQAVALNVAAVVASAVGIFPGGLGIRELMAAGLAPLVDLASSVGLFVTAVDRVLGIAAQGVAALVLALVTGLTPTRAAQAEPVAESRPGR